MATRPCRSSRTVSSAALNFFSRSNGLHLMGINHWNLIVLFVVLQTFILGLHKRFGVGDGVANIYHEY